LRKRLSLLAVVSLFAFGATPTVALADRVAQEETQQEEDDGTDYGWIGLLGLAGLAGLLGRKRDDRDRVVRVDDNTTTRR
jgi:LPXTG-motif cell wall-anchored protein